MSYTITASVYQTSTRTWFNIVERSTWRSAAWTEVDGKEVLTMSNSGTSGILRFKSGTEYFTVALGVYNYKRWVDVSTNLDAGDTAAYFYPQYYTAGSAQAHIVEQQLSSFDVTSAQGTKIQVNYNVSDSHSLECTIVIQ